MTTAGESSPSKSLVQLEDPVESTPLVESVSPLVFLRFASSSSEALISALILRITRCTSLFCGATRAAQLKACSASRNLPDSRWAFALA